MKLSPFNAIDAHAEQRDYAHAEQRDAVSRYSTNGTAVGPHRGPGKTIIAGRVYAMSYTTATSPEQKGARPEDVMSYGKSKLQPHADALICPWFSPRKK